MTRINSPKIVTRVESLTRVTLSPFSYWKNTRRKSASSVTLFGLLALTFGIFMAKKWYFSKIWKQVYSVDCITGAFLTDLEKKEGSVLFYKSILLRIKCHWHKNDKIYFWTYAQMSPVWVFCWFCKNSPLNRIYACFFLCKDLPNRFEPSSCCLPLLVCNLNWIMTYVFIINILWVSFLEEPNM